MIKKIYLCMVFSLLSLSSLLGQINGIWKPVGPIDFPAHEVGQISGIARISQMKFHPSNPLKMYAVNAMGGLFFTDNGGENWRAMGADFLPTTRCSSVCIDHTDDNIIYYGTGDPSYYSNGLGIWKSIDGGISFQRKSTGINNTLAVELLMAPDNHNELIAATRDGLWKTLNGGDTWQQVKVGGDFTNMVFKPGSNTIMYAVSHTEFWKSTNKGDSWTRTSLPGTGIEKGGRIAVSKADPNTVYLSFVGNFAGGTATPVLRSNDSGDSFAIVKSAGGTNLNGYDGNSAGQGNYNYAISCDPTDINHLFTCAHVMFESKDGGQNWQKISDSWATQVHTDMRQIPFSPYVDNVVYNANDGGIWKSNDSGASFFPICNGLAGVESYVGGQSPVKKESISIGAQDNGEFIYRDGIWFSNAGGDVHRNMAYNNLSGDYYYDLSGSGRKRNLPSGSFENLNMPFISSNTDGQDVYTDFPLSNTTVGYFGYFDLYLAKNLNTTPPTWTQITSYNKRVKAIASSPVDANVVYVVTEDQKINRSDNGLATLPSFLTYTTPSATNVTASVAVIKNNPNIVYMVCNNKVYRSGDKGQNWTNITGSLPSVNYHTIIHDVNSTNEAVYLSGYNTVWYKDDTMNDWMNYSSGLPSVVQFRKIGIYNDGTENAVLTIITAGRGVFRAGLYNKNILRKPENPQAILSGIVYNYYQGSSFTQLPTFALSNPLKQGIVDIPTIDPALQANQFAFKFDGYIDIPANGKYTFYLNSDDGSRMFIGNDIVINNDGIHGSTEKSGYAWLEKGKHKFSIEYFQGEFGKNLQFLWEYSGITKQEVPASVLWRLAPEILCPQNGRITVEKWNNINGGSVSNIPLNTPPASTNFRTMFETESNTGDNYGERVSGLICAPYTGNYTFYVAADDGSELWLSTTNSPANKKLIAFSTASVPQRNYYRYPSQQSAKIFLEAGKQYYIEGLHKEGGGDDTFSVAWITPSSEFVAPIPGKHLSPFISNQAPNINITAPLDQANYVLNSTVQFKANASDNGSIAKVQFFLDGISIGSDFTAPYEATWLANRKGTYVIFARAEDNSGVVTKSSPITIIVKAESSFPTVAIKSPINQQRFTTGNPIVIEAEASVPDGSSTINKVILYNGTTILTELFSAPYTYNWINAPIGQYNLSAKAISSSSLETVTNNSTTIFVDPKLNLLPSASIKSPINQTKFKQGVPVLITVDATDQDGTIQKVIFYNGSIILTEIFSSPYNYNWINAPLGSSTLFAKAIDNNGGEKISDPITILVENTLETPDFVKQPDSNNFKIYPNPIVNYSKIDVTLSEGGKSELQIFDISGRMVHNMDLGILNPDKNSIDMNLPNLPDGQYIARLNSGKEVFTKRIILVVKPKKK